MSLAQLVRPTTPFIEIPPVFQHPEKQLKIYFAISSEGFGHSSRALALARHFSHSELLIGSYGYGLDRLRAAGHNTIEIPQELEFVGSHGSFDVGLTILKNQVRVLNFNQILQEEKRILSDWGATLVVADGRMAAVLAAENLKIPCIVLTNQSAYYPFFEQDSPLIQAIGHSFEWVMKLWMSSAEEIFIPDFPPPYTVCLPNLSENSQVKKRTRFVGPLTSWQASEVQAIERPNATQPFVVASLGGHEYRKPLFDALLRVASILPNIQLALLTSFTLEPGQSLPPNIMLYPTVANAAPFFKAADAVVTQAGHSTAMELLTLGKPCVVVPDARQTEQENNARRLAELGVARVLDYDVISESDNDNLLASAILSVLDVARYREQAQRMAQLAQSCCGAAYTASLLREYAGRLQAY